MSSKVYRTAKAAYNAIKKECAEVEKNCSVRCVGHEIDEEFLDALRKLKKDPHLTLKLEGGRVAKSYPQALSTKLTVTYTAEGGFSFYVSRTYAGTKKYGWGGVERFLMIDADFMDAAKDRDGFARYYDQFYRKFF